LGPRWQITASALCTSPDLASCSLSAARLARAWPDIRRRPWVASIQPVTWLASACDPSICDRRRSAALTLMVVAAAGIEPPVARCSSCLMSGPVSVCRAYLVRCSHRSPSSNSPVQIVANERILDAKPSWAKRHFTQPRNHRDPVTASHLAGGEPGHIAKARTAASDVLRDPREIP